jgi:putative DNA primase/helicase
MTNQSPNESVFLSPGTPMISAEKFKAAQFPTLILYQDEWMAWDGSAYQGLEAQTINSAVSEFMGTAKVEGTIASVDVTGKKVLEPALFPFNPKPKDIADVCAMLKHSCHVPIGTMDPPSWLSGMPKQYRGMDPKRAISFKNGLLDLDTGILFPATPFFFTRTALEMDYDEFAPVPALWLEFLQQVTNKRQPLVDLIQEMLGYLVTTDTSLHRIFFLWGRPRSGKGTILRITTALCGAGNMRYPSIETLAGRFGLHNLIGSAVAQITDMNTMSPKDLGTAASRMNGISGEDGQTVERKGISEWNGKISARFQIAGNTLPNFGKNTAAMAERLLIMPFEVSFVGREDRGLTDKLIAELPGILNWALAGLERLRRRGDFIEPADSAAAKTRLIHISDPIHGFIEECCIVKPVLMRGPNGSRVPAGTDKAVLYGAYVRYCEEVHAHAKSLAAFTEDMQAIYPSITASKRSNGDAPQVPCYRGIRFNSATAEKVYQVERDDSDDLGVGSLVVIKRDPSGWPVPRRGDDFSA